jgi:uncharacterized coiled-coil protein SlyX
MTPAGDREGLVSRIRTIRRLAAVPDRVVGRPAGPPTGPVPERVAALEARLAHLEQLVEGLQDSVHREADRHTALIDELQAQVRPEMMVASLAKHARERGL